MFVLLLWTEEGTYSIIKCTDIVEPKNDTDDYVCGQQIMARFNKKTYPARIIKKGGKACIKDVNRTEHSATFI